MLSFQKTAAHPRILIAGCGDLGSAIAQQLASDGFQVFGMRRSTSLLPACVQPVCGDVTQPQSLKQLAALEPEILVYCIAASAQNDEDYRAHYVDGLRNVLEALRHDSRLKHVFFVSSTRVYGQASDALLNETTPAIPSDFGGQRLLEAEHLLDQAPWRATALRLSGIYGPGRLRLLELATHPERWPKQNNWSNRIHRDDAAAFVTFLILRSINNVPVHRCYIVTDSKPAPQLEVLSWLAQRTGTHAGGMESPPRLGGKRLSNARMLETGFSLRYPDYTAGYEELLPFYR